MSTAPSECIALAGITKVIGAGSGHLRVLDSLDLLVRHAEIVAVAGRSGSGKTTLLTIVAGFDAPDAGSVEILGEPIVAAPAWRTMAIVPQSLGIVDELTVGENVALPDRLAGEARDGGDDRDTAIDRNALLAQLGIAHLTKRFPNEISLGEQQRVAIARAAVSRPRVLVADEPISHQNEGWARAIMGVIGELAASGTACLLATHNAIAFESAHRTLELRDGRLHEVA